MKRVRTAALGLVAIAMLIAPGAAAASPSRTDPSRQDLRALVAHGAPGAILLIRHGDTTKRYAAGYADRARKRAMRPSDHFKIASLTKSYTATLVLQLVASGTLNLTDTVERWLPGLVPNGDRITLRELLNHTSGIPDYENDPRFLKPYLDGNLGYYWAPRELVRLATSHRPLFAPGQTRISSYSNTNYVIAGLIVEAATGRMIGDELRRRIFRPLGLRHTFYATRPGLPRPYAHGYMLLDPPRLSDVTALSPSLSPASGAIVSTADDVLHFYRALLAGRLLPPALLGEMRTTISEGSKVDIPGQRYGLGLERFPTPCGPAWGHNGVIPGYITFAFASEDGDRQALLMVNEDAQSLPKPAATRFFQVLDRAYCSAR